MSDADTLIRVQRQDFDPGPEIDALLRGRRNIGGVVTFLGLVRDLAGDTPIDAMTLEHYPGMTEKMLSRIAADARDRWPLDAVMIIHRYGRLEPGDRIVLAVTAAAHRRDAYEANMFLVDWLKTKAPFWKREESEEGEKWVEARSSDDVAAARWRKSS